MTDYETGDLFAKLGIHPERNIRTDAADFYLLEMMTYQGVPFAGPRLNALCATLSAEYLRYLVMAVGGEARHLKRWCDENDEPYPSKLRRYLERCDEKAGGCDCGFCASVVERADAWAIWHQVYDSHEKMSIGLRAAAKAFAKPGWSGRVGGDSWASIARITADAYDGKLKPVIFVDRCFTLQHNYGPVFDKAYRTKGLIELLVKQAAGDYLYLARKASPDVSLMWADALTRRIEEDHDPAWLGVQHTEVLAWR